MKIMDDFLKKFLNDISCQSKLVSTIPVYVFNPSKLMSATTSHSRSLRDSMKKSNYHAIVVDCSEIESKTEFFSRIFEGIVESSTESSLNISYDFSCFLLIFNTIKPVRDIVLIFDNAAQINLTHLDDFVRLWERKSKDFTAQPQLKFIFDDVVCFLGMEARLRDRFRLIESELPKIRDCFDDFVIELIRAEMKFVLDCALMKRFVNMTESETCSFNSILNQIKFLIISHFNGLKSKLADYNSQSIKNFKDIFLFISNLNDKLMKLRPTVHILSPAKDFYSPLLSGTFVDSQSFSEILSELKSLNPNDFASLFVIDSDSGIKSQPTVFEEFRVNVLEVMKKSVSKSNLNSLKDVQIDLVRSLYELIKAFVIEIPSDWIISDSRGNLRRSFEADPHAALQVALKYPSFYLSCQRKCCAESAEIAKIGQINSSNLNSILAPFHHNRPNMPDACLLYRLSLEFPNKTINLMQWYRSFLSVIGAKKSNPLFTYFKPNYLLLLIDYNFLIYHLF